MKRELAIGLFSGSIVVIKVTTKQCKPFFELENLVIVEIARASLDQEDLLLGEVFRQSASNDTASCSTADNNIVKVIDLRGGDVLSSHLVLE